MNAFETLLNCYRTLRFDALRPFLTDDCDYSSIWVLEVLHGADKTIDLLNRIGRNCRENHPEMKMYAWPVRLLEYTCDDAIRVVQDFPDRQNSILICLEMREEKISGIWITADNFFAYRPSLPPEDILSENAYRSILRKRPMQGV